MINSVVSPAQRQTMHAAIANILTRSLKHTVWPFTCERNIALQICSNGFTIYQITFVFKCVC